jgi:hypothetical protein
MVFLILAVPFAVAAYAAKPIPNRGTQAGRQFPCGLLLLVTIALIVVGLAVIL